MGVKCILQDQTPNLSEVGGSNPNLLDNWYFADPIDQREGYIVPPGTPYYSDTGLTTQVGTVNTYTTTTNAEPILKNETYGVITIDDIMYYIDWTVAIRGYVGVGYTIDRWSHKSGASTMIEINSDGILFTPTISGNGLWERVENIPPNGSLITASVLGINSGNGALYRVYLRFLDKSNAIIASASSEYISSGVIYLSIAIPDNTASIDFAVTADTPGVPVKFFAAKLELGSTQTLAHQDADGNWVLNDPPPNRALELAKCQRYFRRIYRQYMKPTQVVSGVARFSIPLDGMRNANSAVSIIGTPTIYNDTNWGPPFSNAKITASGLYRNGTQSITVAVSAEETTLTELSFVISHLALNVSTDL